MQLEPTSNQATYDIQNENVIINLIFHTINNVCNCTRSIELAPKPFFFAIIFVDDSYNVHGSREHDWALDRVTSSTYFLSEFSQSYINGSHDDGI